MISPKITNNHTPDSSTPEAIVESILSPDMSNEEKALAIYNYCWNHTWHWPAPKEGDIELHEIDVVFDVNKQLNVYGYSYCFAIRALAEALYEAAGFEARSVGIGGHVITEVYYEGKYHYLDHDQRGYCRLEDGTIAEIDDFLFGKAQKLLLENENPDKPFFPATLKPRVPYEQKHIYTGYLLNYQQHFCQHNKYRTTHSMNLTLRPGERFTRYWKSCGKWHLYPALVRENMWDGYVDLWKPPYEHTADNYQEAPRLDDGSALHAANGLMVYRPNLNSDSEDIINGAYFLEHIDTSGNGIRPNQPGATAIADFRVRLPYVIVGWPDSYSEDVKISGAAVVSGTWCRKSAGDTLELFVSNDGEQWFSVGAAGAGNGLSEFAFDLSSYAAGTYSYYIRFVMYAETDRESVSITALGIDTSCQLNPAVLPGMKTGKNRFSVAFNKGAEVFEETIVYNHKEVHDRLCSNMHNLHIESNGYVMLRPPEAGKSGFVVYRFQPQAGTRIAWFRAGGIFRSHYDLRTVPDEDFTVYFALNTPDDWQHISKADLPPYLLHYCFETNFTIPIDSPVDSVYLKVVLTRSVKEEAEGAGLIGVKASWGVERDRDTAANELIEITHSWLEDGHQAKIKKIASGFDGTYDHYIDAEHVENVSLSVISAGFGPVTEGPHPMMVKPEKWIKPFEKPSSVSKMRETLDELSKNPSAELLIEILQNNPHSFIKKTAIAAFLTIADSASLEFVKGCLGKHEWGKSVYHTLLALLGADDELIKLLQNSDSNERKKIAELLGVCGTTEIVEPLRLICETESDDAAFAAEFAVLLQIDGHRSYDRFASRLEKLEMREKLIVAASMLTAGISFGYQILKDGLKHSNLYLRYDAAAVLARDKSIDGTALLRPDEAVLLRPALKDSSRWVRREAIAGFGRNGREEDLEALQAVANTEKLPDLQKELIWAQEAILNRVDSLLEKSFE
jgi:HEAT repeat protein